MFEMRRPTVKYLARSGDRREQETGENKAYFFSISSSSSRVRLGSALPPVRRIT